MYSTIALINKRPYKHSGHYNSSILSDVLKCKLSLLSSVCLHQQFDSVLVDSKLWTSVGLVSNFSSACTKFLRVYFKDQEDFSMLKLLDFQIIRVEPVAAKDTRRTAVKQMHDSKIRYPLPSRVQKQTGSLFKAKRPNTCFL